MYYLVTVGYETENLDREGNPRIKKTKYLVEAESAEEVTIIVAKYRSEDSRSSKTMTINEMGIECVIDTRNTPQYYNSKKNNYD